MADFNSLINDIPPVTRFLLVSTALVTFPVLLGVVKPVQVFLSWSRVFRHYEIWRPYTAFFMGGGGFPLIYDFFLIYRNSSSLEKETFYSQTGQYAWAHVVMAIFVMLFNIPLDLPFFFRPLLHAQNYLWCRANPTMKISLFGLLSIPVPYYPAALIVLDLITGGTAKALGGVIGMMAGHAWWFLSTYLPLHPSPSIRRPNPVRAPRWFLNLFGASPTTTAIRGGGFTATRGGFGAAMRAAGGSGATTESTGRSTGYNWGRGGQRLGGEGL